MAIAFVGVALLGGLGIGWVWALLFGLVVLTAGLLLEYRKARSDSAVGKSSDGRVDG